MSRRGRPPGKTKDTCVVSVRIPVEVYERFVKVVQFHGLKSVSTPIARFIQRVATGARTL